MTALLVIISLILIGFFWRQILKGGLISMVVLLILALILFSFSNKYANAEDLPDNFKSFIDDDDRYAHVKCKKPFELKIITQSDSLSHPPL